jgi:hypothetical protein
MMRARMKTAAGAIAWDKLREREPILRKIMDIVMITVKLNKKKVKNASGVRRRFWAQVSVVQVESRKR